MERGAPKHSEIAQELAELALGRLHSALDSLEAPNQAVAPELFELWERQSILPRNLLEEMIVDAASESIVNEIASLATERLHERANDETGIVFENDGPKTQDFHVFLARIQSELGQFDESLATLDEAFEADAFVFETAASMLIEQGELEQAIEHLEKAVLVSDTPELLHEQLYELYSETGNHDAAVDVLINLLTSTHEILYWNILIQELGENSSRLADIRDSLADNHPGLHVEIMMHESDARGVAKAARGKNFTADELWSIGHYLKSVRPAAATKLFLRALTLEGAAARSRVECATLGEHIDQVVPFFEGRDRMDRLEKGFKKVLSRHKNNIPLEREFDRIFG
jgi:tetratricopeptide (TPR) repeat protein